MEDTPRHDLVLGAVRIAESYLRSGEELAPFLITDRLADPLEKFDPEHLGKAQARRLEFLRTAAADETCALAYVSRVGDEEAIVIEHGRAGKQAKAEVFVQRFRPRRGRLRGFKLLGDPIPLDEFEPGR